MANKINQIPQVLFQIETIEDPAVRNNFDILNRELTSRRQNKQPPASNIAFSPGISAFSIYVGTDPVYPPGMTLTITTKGNPVRITAEPMALSSATAYYSRCTIFQGAGNFTSCSMGLARTNLSVANSVRTTIVTQQLGAQALGSTSISHDYAFPFFQYTDDKVAAGTYQYSLFVFNMVNEIALAACRLVAKEG